MDNNNDNNNNSILSTIGAEITGIMSPVSICMLLVVLLVYPLSSPLSPPSSVVTAANLVYSESESDPPSQKLEGALLNAVVFVAFIAAVTFLLVLLYYFNFTRFLVCYMRFSSFVILASLGGSIMVSLIRNFSVPVDFVTFSVLLFNFSLVGVFSIFTGCVPIVVKQGYTVVLGIILAAWFTKLPEWTTWALLVALSFYDLVAVLVPGGPLKILVELASRRDEELPALVYEARPNVTQNRDGNGRGSSLGLFVGMASRSGSVELQEVSRSNDVARLGRGEQTEIEIDEERSPLVENIRVSNERVESGNGNRNGNGNGSGNNNGNGNRNRNRNGDGEASDLSVHGIRLGLGDFVFYSVLVGRAAMYDLMTVYACYLAIICGLGCTLILLAISRHALPALPISIMLGVAFYFLTRLLMEPFVVGTSTNLLMF